MEQLKNKLKIACFHCGENCINTTIHIQEKTFCCSGCKMVYEILNKNELCAYYDLYANPGITQKTSIRANKFSFLTDPTVVSKLIQFTNGKQTRASFYLPQMHCSSCIWLLENLYKLNSEIISASVDFPKKEITVVFNEGNYSLRKVVELLTSIGYEPHINLSDLDEKKIKLSDRPRLFKLGIAGFCFGNIMMFSLPEYFSSGIYYEKGLSDLFSYLILVLSLPVFFYSASEFYISAWKGLKHRFLTIDAPIVLALAITFSRSIYEIVSQSGTGYLDSMSGIVFFMLVGRMFQDRVYNSISFERDYKSYFPISVSIKKESSEENIPVSNLKVGDRIVIRNNELIPADSILFFGKANIDYSFVTGESIAVEKSIGEIIYAGGKQIGSAIEMEVVKDVSQSYLTQLWNNETFISREEKEISFIHTLSKHFTLLLFSIAFLTSIYWWFFDASKILTAVTAVLIVACPCSLLLSATFTNGNIVRIFTKNKFFVKNSSIIENLANCTHIVFDKTGTLTQNDTTLLVVENTQLSFFEEKLIRSLAAHSSHPFSLAIFNHYPQHPIVACEAYCEYPGEGVEATILGMKVRMGSSHFILNKSTEYAKRSKVFVEINDQPKGSFDFKNTYRKGFEELIQSLKNDYTLSLISGDNDADKEFLQPIIGAKNELQFYQSPSDKLNHIVSLQAKNKKVIMLGDGLNDAGALKLSDVGIVISEHVNNFSPACDGVLDSSEFTNLKKLIDFAKAGKNIIKGSFLLSLIYNSVGITYAVQGKLSPLIAALLMPASSLSILLFTVGLSSFVAKRKGLL